MAARPATLGDKLILIPHVFIGLGVGLARLATRPITNDVKPPTAFKDFVYATFRHVLSQVTVTQEKWLTVPTEKTYLDWAAKKSLETDTAVLASGLKVHWVGKPSSEKIFLYFHGGGYVNPITPQHLDWLLELQTDLSKTKSVAVAVVGYTCSPEGQYPVQLREGAESLLWLLNAQGKKPEDIFIGGDSAGANMALGLLSHILHPHPNFEDKLQVKLSGPLAGAILTSPWVKFPTDDESATRNAGSDFVCKAAAVRWADAFLGSAPYDNYTQPLLAAKNWFSDLEKVVKGIIVWGGEQEVLIDSIDAIAQKLQDSFPGTEYVRSPGGAHVGWLSHKIIGIEGKEESTQAIEGWMAARL